jgi:hypothetical protein
MGIMEMSDVVVEGSRGKGRLHSLAPSLSGIRIVDARESDFDQVPLIHQYVHTLIENNGVVQLFTLVLICWRSRLASTESSSDVMDPKPVDVVSIANLNTSTNVIGGLWSS